MCDIKLSRGSENTRVYAIDCNISPTFDNMEVQELRCETVRERRIFGFQLALPG